MTPTEAQRILKSPDDRPLTVLHKAVDVLLEYTAGLETALRPLAREARLYDHAYLPGHFVDETDCLRLSLLTIADARRAREALENRHSEAQCLTTISQRSSAHEN